MKIAILTQPLKYNYGGILQCYALQAILESMGHNVIVLNRRYPKPNARLLTLRFGSIAKCIIRKYIMGDKKIEIMSPWGEDYYIEKYTDDQKKGRLEIGRFINHYIHLTRPLLSSSELAKYVENSDIECIIVGSDQVWREIYAPCIEDYFLGFLPEKDKRLKITYAASFGNADSPISEKHLNRCIRFSKCFSAISMREYSGVELMKHTFGHDAAYVLDPTLLLSAEQYTFDTSENETGGLVSYVLDENDTKNQMIKMVADRLQIVKKKRIGISMNVNDGDTILIPSIENWLAAFANAEFVVTDSFHGCVFSIINQKPFIVIANKGRGLDRFTSILRAVGLEDRLVYSFEDLESRISRLAQPIDYNVVTDKLNVLREQSLNYLKKHTKGEIPN